MADFSASIRVPSALSADEIAAWASFRAQNPALYSPYFHFEYTRLLAQLRADVYVLVIKSGGRPQAFLPFQGKVRGNKIRFARSIGAPMTDYHGLICAPGSDIDIAQALKRAGHGVYDFNAMVASGGAAGSHIRLRQPCAVMDVSGGAEAWRAGRDSSYRRHLKSHRRRARKSEDLGPREFNFQSRADRDFQTLIDWKRQKFSETGKYDVLSAGWTRGMLQELWQRGAGHASGLWADMHTFSIGGELAAIDLGLTDGRVFHSWIVAYNNDMHTLAPGIQLLEALIDEAPALGYGRIDLGSGLDGYKRHYASEDVSVISGFIAANGVAALLARLYGGLESFGEKNLGALGRLPGKLRRRYSQIHACEPRLSGRARAMFDASKGVVKSS